MSTLENLQKEFKTKEDEFYELRQKLAIVNERLKNIKDPQFAKLKEAKILIEDKLVDMQEILNEADREAEGARLDENILIAKEGFKGDPKKDVEGFKQFQLDKIKRFFENGIDDVVVHGSDARDPMTREAIYDKDGNKMMSAGTDQDAHTANLFLQMAQTKKKYGLTYQEVAGSAHAGIQHGKTTFVQKGEQYKRTVEDWGKVFLHIDTGGKKGVSINFDAKTGATNIIIDHHVAKLLSENTSGGELTLELLKKLGMIKPEPWMEAYTKFNTEYDNYSFDLTKEDLREKFWKTPRGLMKVIPRERMIEFFKEGKDPDTAFTDAELDSIMIEKKKQDGTIESRKLSDIAEAQKKHLEYSRDLVAAGEIEAIVEGITSYKDELGIISFNTVKSKTYPDGSVKDTNNAAEGGLVVKALGIQTFIKFWENGGGFFLTSTKDITPYFNSIKDKIPGMKLIRGKMIVYSAANFVDPKGLDEVIYRKNTKERFLKSKTDPRVFAEMKKNATREIQQNYFIQKNPIKIKKEELLKAMGLIEEHAYENLPEEKLTRMGFGLKRLLRDAKDSGDKVREEKVAKALALIETAHGKLSGAEDTPEEIKKVAEEMRASLNETKLFIQTVETDLAEAKEMRERYEAIIAEEETEPVVDDEKNIENDKEMEADVDSNLSDRKLNSPEGHIDSGKIEIAKLPSEIVEQFKGEDHEVYINNPELQGTLLAREGKYLFRAIQGRMFTIAKVGEFYLPFYISSAETSGKNQGEWYPFFGYTGNWLVKGDVGKKGEMEYSDKITEIQNLLNKNFKIPAKYLDQFGEMAVGGDRYLKDRDADGKLVPNPDREVIFDINTVAEYESWFVEKENRHTTDLEETEWVQQKTGFYPTGVVNKTGDYSATNWRANVIALTEGTAKVTKKKAEKVKKAPSSRKSKKTVADTVDPNDTKNTPDTVIEPVSTSSTSAEDILTSWDTADVEKFKIYQSNIIMGEKRGAVEKLFAINNKTKEIVPTNDDWKYSTGNRKDFIYYFDSLFDIKNVVWTKGMQLSDLDVVPAKMNPDGTVTKGKITLKTK